MMSTSGLALALLALFPLARTEEGSGEVSLDHLHRLEACASAQASTLVDEGAYQRRMVEATNPTLVQAEFFFMDSFSFDVHDPTSRIDVGLTLSITFTWRDDTLYDESVSCSSRFFPVLAQYEHGNIINMAPSGRIALRAGPLPPSYIGAEYRSLSANLWVMEFRITFVEREKWRYFAYPNDPQHITANLIMKNPELRFANCMPDAFYVVDSNGEYPRLFEANSTSLREISDMRDILLEDEWNLDTPWLLAYDQYPPDSPLQGVNCLFEVHLQRNPLVYIVKSMTLDILIVVAGIAAILINPSVPPQMGARLGLMMTSMLMTINKSARRDLGLGPIGYMMLLDWLASMPCRDLNPSDLKPMAWNPAFRLPHPSKADVAVSLVGAVVNVFILIVMLLETLTVHHLINKKRTTLAATVDNAFRTVAPLLYALVIAGFAIGFTGVGSAAAIYAVIIALALVGSFAGYVWLTLRQRRLRLEARAAKLIADGVLGDDQAVRETALAEVFAEFDTDRSGTLEEDEVRVLLKALRPHLRKTKRTGEALNVDSLVLRLSLESQGGGVGLKQLSDAVESLVVLRNDEPNPIIAVESRAQTVAASPLHIEIEMSPPLGPPVPEPVPAMGMNNAAGAAAPGAGEEFLIARE